VRVETVDLTHPDAVEALWERLVSNGELPRWLVNSVGGFRSGTVAATEAETTASCRESTSTQPGGAGTRPDAWKKGPRS